MARRPSSTKALTTDSFQNFMANVGIGTQNVASGGTYGFNPITRNHTLLEWAYRGSWIVRKTIDCPAEDMTRQGVTINDDMPPDRVDQMQTFWRRKLLWQRLGETLKWSRLYGGALAVVVIKGQDFSKPLRVETVGKGQFQGLMVLDRWMVQPNFSELVSDPGAPDYGNPVFYNTVADARTLPNLEIHHSRCLRFEGIELPYWQKNVENGWGLSVLEPLWDRLLAYDSVTQGAAQLVYKAHLRTLKLPKLRELIATGGKTYQAVLKQIDMIRLMQANEGLTLLDGEDELQIDQYAFSGLSDLMGQFGMQLSGSADVPMTRMFGQSPMGMNSTGDSDLRNYYDGCKSRQETELADPVQLLMELTHRSLYGAELPAGFGFQFNPLWQLTDETKSTLTTQTTQAVTQALDAQVIDAVTAAKELRTLSRTTGVFTNITDEYLVDLKNNPPQPPMGDEPLGDEDPETGDQGLPPGPVDADVIAAAAWRAANRPLDPAARRAVEGAAAEAAAANAATIEEAAQRALVAEERRKAAEAAAQRRTVALIAEAARNAEEAARLAIAEAGTRVDAVPPFKLGTATRDACPVVEFHGLTLLIETEKGQKRYGNGWAVAMPARYGYVSGTSSAEGPTEQMDVFVGDDLEAPRVWIVEQQHPVARTFDEHKIMVGFRTRDEAKAAYVGAFSDGLGLARIAKIREIAAEDLPRWLQGWRYGSAPSKPTDGDARSVVS